jgi:Uma2 family endonuclease
VVTRVQKDIDFSTFPAGDGEPMADTTTHRKQMVNLIFMLTRLVASHLRVFVGGNMLMDCTKGFGWDHVSPDVFVTFDVEPGDRDIWQTWNEGDHFAEVVFEITSPSTINDDLGKKRQRYARHWWSSPGCREQIERERENVHWLST